jgi:hypothetical protein
MIPKGAQGIGHLATRIGREMIPKAGDAYTASDLGMISGLIGMIAQDYDRAADVLVAEHEALAPILQEAAARLDDAGLKARIDAALALKPASLRVSDLAARSDVTLRLLVDAHAAVEDAATAGADWAGGLDDEIWRFLETHVAARAYDVAL